LLRLLPREQPERRAYRHSTANQVGHQCRQTIVSAAQPVVFDRRVLVVDIAGLTKAFAKCGCIPLRAIFRQPADQPDHGQRPLLRPRRERPSRSRAAESSDEFAPSKANAHLALRAYKGKKN
jgi:hypothetical protein